MRRFLIVWLYVARISDTGFFSLPTTLTSLEHFAFMEDFLVLVLDENRGKRSITHPYTRSDFKIECIDFLFICCFDLCIISSQLS